MTRPADYRAPFRADPPFKSLSLIEPSLFEHDGCYRLFGIDEYGHSNFLAIGPRGNLREIARKYEALNHCKTDELAEMFLPSKYQIA
jgi:hypothetical protein